MWPARGLKAIGDLSLKLLSSAYWSVRCRQPSTPKDPRFRFAGSWGKYSVSHPYSSMSLLLYLLRIYLFTAQGRSGAFFIVAI